MPPGSKVNILLVDDNPRNLLALRSLLDDAEYNLVEAGSGTDALKFLLQDEFAVVLMDVEMPILNGIETAKLIRSRKKTKHVPIVFVTGVSTDDMSVFEGYSAGAVDYITTPIIPEILKAKVAAFVELYKKTEQIKQQVMMMRELEKNQHERELESERQSHEIEKLKLREQFLLREKELEAENSRRLAEQAQLLAKSNAELESFAQIASHDLQEPLNTIDSYCQLLEWNLGDQLDREAKQYLTFTRTGTKRMKALIHNLLAFSKVKRDQDAATLEAVDLCQLVGGIIENLASTIADTHAQISVDPLPTVTGDAFRLEQLFQNLISNAIKFHGDKPPSIHISVRRTGNFWEFCVADNGIGIDKKYFEQIFGMFKRLHTRDEFEGTGLGLTLCKSVVESYGGRIWIESEKGKGTKFFYTLPVRTEDKNSGADTPKFNRPRTNHESAMV